MSFTAAFLGGLGSAVGSSALSSLGSPGDPSGSMQSVVQGPIPPPSTPAPRTESKPTSLSSAFELAKEQALTGAATSASSAVVSSLEDALGLSGRTGEAYRESLQSAFPELNPWELAGSSSAGPLGGMLSSGRESAQQRSEHNNQQRSLDKTLANQYDMAELASATSMANTELNNRAALEMLEYNQRESEQRTNLLREQVISAPVQRQAVSQSASESAQREHNLRYGDSTTGKLIGTAEDVLPAAKSFVADKLESVFSAFDDWSSKLGGVSPPRPPGRGQPGTPVFYRKYWQGESGR